MKRKKNSITVVLSVYLAAFICLTFIYAAKYVTSEKNFSNLNSKLYNRSYEALIFALSDINSALEKNDALVLEGAIETAKLHMSFLPFSEPAAESLQLFFHDLDKLNDYGGASNKAEYSGEIVKYLVKHQASDFSKPIEEIGGPDFPMYRYESKPVSANLSDEFPVLEKLSKVSEKTARAVAAKALGSNVRQRNISGGTIIPKVYGFMCQNAYAEVTVNGGMLYKMVFDYRIGDVAMNEENCRQKAINFMKEQGYSGFECSRTLFYGNIYVFDFVYLGIGGNMPVSGNNMSVRVGVAADKGKICLFSAERFFENCKEYIPLELP